MDVKKQVTFAILSIFGLIGAFLVGHGINGMMIYEPLVGELCMSDDDCLTGKTCCLFSESNYGVCAAKDYCGDINTLTVEQPPSEYLVEQPALVAESRLEAVTGITIVALALIILYMHVKIGKLKEKVKEESILVEKLARKKPKKRKK